MSLPPSLRELYLEENYIERLDADSLRGLTSLQRLFLRNNQLHTIQPAAFQDLIALQLLDLQSNALTNITSPLFANSTRLEWLDLSQNTMLHELTGRPFHGLSNLKVLQMSRIKTPGDRIKIEDTLFEPLVSLETLEMYDSPGTRSQLVC